MTTEEDILFRLLPDLKSSLDVSRVTHFLTSEGVLTAEEGGEIVRIPRRSQAVERLVALVQLRRGADCGRVLLCALRSAMQHTCHSDIVGNLERELEAIGSLGLPLLGSPVMQAAPLTVARAGPLSAACPEGRLSGGHGNNAQRISLSKKDLRKVERLNSRLNKEMQKFQKNFKELHRCIRKKLSNKRVSFDNVKNSVQYLPCFKNSAAYQHILGHNTAVGRAKDMRDLFSALLAYTSWYNYQLSALLVINFGGKGGKGLIQSYEARLQDHLQRLVSQCPPFWPSSEEGTPSRREVPEGYIIMDVVVKASYETCTLRDVSAFKNALSELLQLHLEAMILGSVQPGEVGQCCMTWMVPLVAMQHTVNIAIARMVQLEANQILQLRIGPTTVVTASRPGQLHSQPGSSSFSSGPQRSMSVDSTFTDGPGPTHNDEGVPVYSECQHNTMAIQRLPLDSGRGTLSPTTPQLSVNGEAFPDVTSSSTLSGGHVGRRGSGTFSPRLDQQQLPGNEGTSCQEPHQSRQSTLQNSARGPASYHGDPPARGPASYHGNPPARGAAGIAAVSHANGSINGTRGARGARGEEGVKAQSLPRTKDRGHQGDRGHLGVNMCDYRIPMVGTSDGSINLESTAFCFPEPGHSSHNNLRVPTQAARPPSLCHQKLCAVASDTQLQLPLPSLTAIAPPSLSIKLHSSEDDGLPPPLPTPTTPRFPPPPSHHPPPPVWLLVSEVPDIVPPPSMFSNITSLVHEEAELSGPYDSLLSQELCGQGTGGTLHRVRSESIFGEGTLSRLATPVHRSPCVAEAPPIPLPHEVKTPPRPAASRPTTFALSDIDKLLDSSNCQHDTPPSWETKRITSPHLPFPVVNNCATFKSQRKTSSFLLRVLTRASEQWSANVFIVTISANVSGRRGHLKADRGRKLMAMYKMGEQVYARDCHGNEGFVPYSICRLSLKHYRHTEARKLAHTNLYLQSADGVDDDCDSIGVTSHPLPVIRMVAIQDHKGDHQGMLPASVGDKLRALYCDDQWVYAINQTGRTGFLPRTACRLTVKGQEIFKEWILPQRLFQSDFVIKYNEPVPDILSRKQAVVMPTFKPGEFVVIEDSYTSSESNNGKPVFLKKGLRFRLLEAKHGSLKVTTGPGVSCWVPSQFCTPCRSSRPSSVYSRRSRSPGSRSRSTSPFTSPLHASVGTHQMTCPPGSRSRSTSPFTSPLHASVGTHQMTCPPGSRSRSTSPFTSPLHASVGTHQMTLTPVSQVRPRQPVSMAQRPFEGGGGGGGAYAASIGSLRSAAMSRGSLHCSPMDTAMSRGSLAMDTATSRGSLHCSPMDAAMSRGSLCSPMDPKLLSSVSGGVHLQAQRSGDKHMTSSHLSHQWTGVPSAKPMASLIPSTPLTNKLLPPQRGMSPNLIRNTRSPVPLITGTSPFTSNNRLYQVPSTNGILCDASNRRASRISGMSPIPAARRNPLRNGVSPDCYSRRESPLPQWGTPGVSPTHSGVYRQRDPSNRRSWGAMSSGSRGGLSTGSRGDNSRHSPAPRSESFI